MGYVKMLKETPVQEISQMDDGPLKKSIALPIAALALVLAPYWALVSLSNSLFRPFNIFLLIGMLSPLITWVIIGLFFISLDKGQAGKIGKILSIITLSLAIIFIISVAAMKLFPLIPFVGKTFSACGRLCIIFSPIIGMTTAIISICLKRTLIGPAGVILSAIAILILIAILIQNGSGILYWVL